MPDISPRLSYTQLHLLWDMGSEHEEGGLQGAVWWREHVHGQHQAVLLWDGPGWIGTAAPAEGRGDTSQTVSLAPLTCRNWT